MIDIVLIIGFIIILFFAFKASKKHMKGEGGCCQGGSVPILPDKILDHVEGKKEVVIHDMECDRCAYNIKKALNSLDGVSAIVSLYQKNVIISYSKEISDETIVRLIEKTGYHVNSIHNC